MLLEIIAILFGVVSLITFFLYGIDKIKAVRGAWRIPEKVLLGFSLLGGAVGGYLAMRLFHHKTMHWYFTVLNIFGIIWQVGLLLFLLLLRLEWINL